MSWPMVKLGDVAPAIPIKNVNLDEDELVWQLNLDQVESNTGKIIDKVKESIDESNEVIGSFMCQGKMPETVLQRYLKLKEGNHAPDNINLLIDNYYEALKHPNNDDIENLKKAIA